MQFWRHEIRARLAGLDLEPVREAAIVEELAQDPEDCYDELLSGGATPKEAERLTLTELRESDLLVQKLRCMEPQAPPESYSFGTNGRKRMMNTLWRDLRYGARLLGKTPGFTAAALATLAICIGANLSIFAVVDAILLRPLPFPEPDRLATIFNTYPKAGVDRDGASITNYYERRGKIDAFTELAIYREETSIIGEVGSTQRERTMLVSPEFFSTLGVRPVIGRAFRDEEMSYQANDATILTDGYWRKHFNADPNILGRDVRVDGVQKKVIGVLPPSFHFLSTEAGLYFPLASSPADREPKERHSGSSTNMIARLKPGVTLAVAQAQIDAHNAGVAESYPQAKMIAEAGFRSIVASLRADHTASVRPTLLLVQAGVMFLLLICGVNLVNLLVIRASGRTKELAIRQALGAGRGRIASQLMVETVLLTLAGGVLGLFVAAGGISLLAALGVDQLPLGAQIAFDGRLALTALIGAVAMGFVLGSPIAAYTLRVRLTDALQSESRGGGTSLAAQRLRHGFIVAQIALAFVLLTGAGLLGLSLKHVTAISPGFSAERILSGQFSLPWKNYSSPSARIAFAEKLTEEIGRQPGVSAVGLATNAPLSGDNIKSAVTPKGYVPVAGESVRAHYFYEIAGDYLAALGVPLREGRLLDNADLRRAERVCVVDEEFARRYWPKGLALGQRLFRGSKERSDDEAFTVVGVVGAVKQAELTDNQALGAVYFPIQYNFNSNLFLMVRASGLPESLGMTVQSIVRKIDPELPVNDLRSMDARVADSLITRRSSALLVGLFAAVALLLTAIGVYGVLSFAVSQRRREIGIRLALGALPGQIGRHVLALGLRLLAAGGVLGIAGAYLAGRAMQGLLFGVPPFHFTTLIGAAVVMSVTAIIACWLPTRRAARVDPIEALRSE